MDLINKDFQYHYPDFYGTEDVSLFLYSLIKCCRPQRLLEIGAGYSTFFIAKALKDIKDDIENTVGESLVNVDWFKNQYNPYLEVIENESIEKNIEEIKNKLNKLNLSKFVKIKNQNIYSFDFNKKYDFIWIDFGNGKEYLDFFEKFEKTLVEGGVIIIHSTIGNLWGKLFETELKLKIQKGIYSNLELISFFEPHKSNQNSFTVIKKTKNYPISNLYA
jgi:predicted O-methyltransferase YrrM